MNLRQRLAAFLLHDQTDALRNATDALWELWEKRPWLAEKLSPTVSGRLKEALDEAVEVGELDSQTVSAILRRMRYVPLAAVDDSAERQAAVAECRLLWRNDVITQQIIGLWTDFGFGQVLEIKVEDEEGAKVFKEFWEADRNGPVLKDRRLSDQSDKLLHDGERFWVGFTNAGEDAEERPKGGVTLRTIPPEEIVELVTDPDDDAVTLFYKREWTPKGQTVRQTLYYPDWEASDEELGEADLPEDAKRADEEDGGTDVGVLHFGIRMINGRGWPLMTAGAAWVRAYRDFMQDRVTIIAAVAMYVRKLKFKGGSRVRDDVQRRLESTLTRLNQWAERNPPAAAGSTWLENMGADMSPFPLTTGASDAQADGGALIAQAGLGGRVFPHWLGRGEAFRLATACYSSDTVYLGEHGWKHFSEWRDGEKIASYNHDKRQMEYVLPTALHVYPYDGDMVAIQGRGVDALVTPNHRMLVLNENNVSKFCAKTDFEIMRADALPSRFALPAKAVLEDRPDKAQFGFLGGLVWEIDPWLGFLGWWLAEGSLYKDKRPECYTVSLGVSSKAIGDVAAIRAILSRLPFRFYESTTKRGMLRWRSHDTVLYRWLRDSCGKGARQKRLPSFVFSLNLRQTRILLSALWAGDGHQESRKHYRGFFTSTSKALIDGVQILMLRTGDWGGVAVNRKAGAHKHFPNAPACWVVHRNEYSKRSLVRERNVCSIPYQGLVWCFEVPSGMFITRRNGQPLIAGNTAMETPVRRAFRRYQLFWADVWRDLVKLVLKAWEVENDVKFDTYHAEVSTDALVEMDVKVMSEALVDLYEQGLVPTEPAIAMALTLLGVANVEDEMDKWREGKEEREAEAEITPPTEEEEIMPEEVRALAEAAARVVMRG